MKYIFYKNFGRVFIIVFEVSSGKTLFAQLPEEFRVFDEAECSSPSSQKLAMKYFLGESVIFCHPLADTHIYTHTRARANTHTYTHAPTHTNTHPQTHTRTHAHKHTHTYKHPHPPIHTYTHTIINTQAHIHPHPHTPTHTNTHTQTHTQMIQITKKIIRFEK